MTEIKSIRNSARSFLRMTENYIDCACTSFGATIELVRLINLMQQDTETYAQYQAVMEQLNCVSEALAMIRLKLVSKELQDYLR